MTIQQNFQQRPKTLKEFTATGVLVTDVPTTMCNKLRVVVENAGGGNTILVKGKLFPQTAWQTLATINGSTAGTTVDISVVDEYQIECTAYAASGGTPKVMASAFFNQASGGGGGGTITGASNVGTAGEGLFDAEVGGVLNFRNINAGSSKVTVALDGANKEVDIDVNESQINVRNLDNVSPGNNLSFAGWDGTGQLAGVPGWAYDDAGALQIGAQNAITVPAGTTDYISISISPTVSNPGLTNLSGVQLNSPINQTVGNYNGFQVFGYGTSKPTNFTGYLSNPGYSGVGTNQTHFSATGTADITGILNGFSMNTTGDAATLNGVSITPTGSFTNATGISIDLNGVTSATRVQGINVQGGTFVSQTAFTTTSSLPGLVDSGNIIRPVFEVSSGAPITGTDVIMTNLAGLMDFKDDYASSVLGLGSCSIGFVSQIAASATSLVDKATILLAGLATEASSAGGTITDAYIVRAFAANFGGTLNIGTIYGLKVDDGLSAMAAQAFGLSVDDQGTENYLPRLVVSGVSKTVSSADVAIDINAAKAFRLGRVTTAQRLAMTPLTGLMVYDTDTNKPYHADGSSWHQF